MKQTEHGNALFLILIAVVLFAALSYAITQSNRSSGNVGRETNTISGTTIQQYATGVRTGIQRMMLRGVTDEELLFNDPAHYSGDTIHEVFHPDGGGVAHQWADPNIVESGDHWYYYYQLIQYIGTGSPNLITALPNVKKSICEQINQQIHGTTSIPGDNAHRPLSDMLTPGGFIFKGTNIEGHAVGCIEASDGYLFYQTLVEK